jgi:dTDP-4-dehydrorhamnose 3,5-epimerase
MDVIATELPAVKILHPQRFQDERGFFCEVYHSARFNKAIGQTVNFIQDNFSLSLHPGTLRGLHFQIAPFEQSKLVRCDLGRILDIVVDIRHGSPTYGQYISAVLSAERGEQLWIPAGFAHGFYTLEANCAVTYKVDKGYSAAHDRGLAFDDPNLAIGWPNIAPPLLSPKDRLHPKLADLPAYFSYLAYPDP